MSTRKSLRDRHAPHDPPHGGPAEAPSPSPGLFHFGGIPHHVKDNLRSTGTSLLETWGKFYLPERSVEGFTPGSLLQCRPEALGTATSLQLICEPTPPLQASHSSNHTSPLLIFHRSHGLSNSSRQTLDNLLFPEASNAVACLFLHTLPSTGTKGLCTWQVSGDIYLMNIFCHHGRLLSSGYKRGFWTQAAQFDPH